MKPHFIGIGGERCGTSWLYSCLSEHPGLCMPFKAVNFFHREDNFSKGVPWYEGHFKSCGVEKLAGEITTGYLYSAQAAQRIGAFYPNVKLFVSLRNPVDRAFSHYQNEMMGGIVDRGLSFDEAVSLRPLITERSLYAEGLCSYMERFPREQLLILVYEDALEDPGRFLTGIFRFLGADAAFQPSMAGRRVNEGGVPRSVPFDRVLDRTGDVFRKIRMQAVLRALKSTGVTGALRRANIRSRSRPLTQAKRAQLLATFEPDIRKVERILGRELAAWRT